MTESLFPDLGAAVEDRIKALDLEIEGLLYGRHGGPFGLSLSDDEKLILRAVRYRRGFANAISIREIQTTRANATMSDREIKQIVRTLRINFRLPIGSSKSGTGGYFLMITPDDHAILRSQILDQVRAEIEVLKATSGPHAALELLGQLQLEVR